MPSIIRASVLILIVLAIGLGASIVIAVALAARYDPAQLTSFRSVRAFAPSDEDRTWWRAKGGDEGRDLLLANERRSRGVTIAMLAAADPEVYRVNHSNAGGYTLGHAPGGDTPWVRVLRIESGWPARCLRGRRLEHGVPKVDIHPFTLRAMPVPLAEYGPVEYRGAMPTSIGAQQGQRPHFLPLVPIWSGLAINAAFYGGIALLAAGAGLGLRSRLRRRKNCCPTCGYRLPGAVHEGCPECGWGRAR